MPWTQTKCRNPDCDKAECITQCECERGEYPSCQYRSCYDCFLDRRSDYLECILCGSWHNPAFDTCFKCRPQTQGRDDAALALRQLILWRDGHTCKSCGINAGELHHDPRRVKPGDDGWCYAQMHIDHIVPCAKGGRADEWNLQILCEVCNTRKGSRWYVGCPYEEVRTRLCRTYFLLGRSYFNEENLDRFLDEWGRFRATRTWDPTAHKIAGFDIGDADPDEEVTGSPKSDRSASEEAPDALV